VTDAAVRPEAAPGLRPGAFLAGAPKSGSSALANFLAQHPEACVSRIKEPNFLCPDLDLPGPRSEEEYLALFETTPRTRVLVDASILYLYSRRAAEAIRDYASDPRVVVVLRDPVAAMASWHGQMVFTANEPIRDFAEALEAEADRKAGRRLPTAGTTARSPSLLFYREVMRFGAQVEHFQRVLGRGRLHVLLQEDLRDEPARTYRGVCEFLGLDPGFAPDFRPVNESRERRSWRAHYVAKQLFAPAARRLLPARLRLRLIDAVDRVNSRPSERPPLDPALEERLRAGCRPDVERLEALLGRDLSRWAGRS